MLVAPLGIDHLDEVAELRFAIAFGDESRSWTWDPPTGEVTGSAGSFRLGHAETDDQRRAEQQFLADSFWLAPQLHVRWAGAGAVLVDRGESQFDGRSVRRIELHYDTGGYTPGDTHELFVDDARRLVGWAYHPGGGPATLEARFEDYVPVGPLEVATTREVLGSGMIVRVTELGWVPVGAAVADDPAGDGALLVVSPAGCRLGPLAVRWSPGASVHRVAGSGDTYDGVLVVRQGAQVSAHRWSTATLGLEDPGWFAASGIPGCDFRSVDAGTLRAALSAADPTDRRAMLALLWQWTQAATELPARFAGMVRPSVERCAASGDCDPLYAWLRRLP